MNDLVLLAGLLHGPAYGYALKKTAGLIFGASALHNNIVYPSLRKFVQNGWVQVSSVPGERGQQRKQYRITAAGRKYLIEQLKTFGEREAADHGAFLLRVAFFDVLPKTKCLEIMAARKASLTARAARLAALRESTAAQSYAATVLYRLLAQGASELEWVGDLERKYRADKGGN